MGNSNFKSKNSSNKSNQDNIDNIEKAEKLIKNKKQIEKEIQNYFLDDVEEKPKENYKTPEIVIF